MFIALNMKLDIVRTVLENEVNDIYVCTDLQSTTNDFYTLISIGDKQYKKIVAEKMSTGGLFFGNRDFIGSFALSDRLNLVFRYYQENLLSMMGSIYLYNFPDCKKAAMAAIATFAESNVFEETGLLLLHERNINITKDGDIILNYFLDFKELREHVSPEEFYREVAGLAFRILELNYKDRYQSPELYPDDLRLFYLKLKSGGFQSLGQVLTMIRGMSDKPVEMRGAIWWIKSRFQRAKKFLFRNSLNTFLTILVIVTLIYACVQIGTRIRASRALASNVSYYGIEYIGDVYLGNEE